MKANVCNIPHSLASGDNKTNKYHATMTNKCDQSPTASTHFIPHQHYRLVLDIIGTPLTKFASSYELVATVHDALISDYQGYAKPWGIAEGYSKGRGKGTRLLPLTYPYPSEGYIIYPSEG